MYVAIKSEEKIYMICTWMTQAKDPLRLLYQAKWLLPVGYRHDIDTFITQPV